MSDSGGSLTRDVVLRLKTESLVGADFKTITDQVNALTAAINNEIEAAKKGAITQTELTQSLNKLKDAGKGLESLASQIQIFKNFETQIANQTVKVREAADALAAFQARIDTGERIPRAAQQLRSLEGAVTRTTNALTALQNAQAAQGNKLQQAGIDTNNLAAATLQLLGVVDKTGAGIRTLDGAISNYTKNLRLYNEETKRQEKAARDAAKAEEERAVALKKVAESFERAREAQRAEVQARQLERVRAGAEEYINRRRQEEQTERDRIKFIEDSRKARLSAIGQEADEALRAFNKQRDDERTRAAEMEKLRQQSAAGLRAINARHAAEQVETTRKNIEEQNRLREQQIIAERETERRASLGRIGRRREDIAEERRLRRERAQELEAESQRGATGRAQTGLFGLPAYQVTNLGYQATDVLQGFAQGVSPGVILAQQGPQIFQIFGLAALKWFPVVATVVGTATVAFAAFNTALREAAAQRQFAAAIEGNTNLIRYNAKQLVEYQKNIQDMGVSWADAGKMIRTAISQNIVSDRITQLAQSAKDVSRVTGEEVPDAMKKLVTGFTNGERGIRELNQELGFLTDKDVIHVEELYKHGKALEALDFAYNKLATRYKSAGEQALTPLQKSVEALNVSWNELLRTLSDSETVSSLINILTRFINLIDRGVQAIDDWTDAVKRMPKQPEISEEEYYRLQAAGINVPPPKSIATTFSGVTPAPGGLASGNVRVLAGTLKTDTSELVDLLAALQEASKGLPEGFSLRVADPSLHSKFVAGTNKISEHYMRRALDYAVLDAEGNVVPGYMRRGGPFYTQIDEAVQKYIQEKGLGPLAIGSLFQDKPDAGHLSLRGPEAEQSEITRRLPGIRTQRMQAEATQKERDAARDALRDTREAFALEQARNREEAARLERIKVEREVRAQFPNLTNEQQRVIADARMSSFLLKQRIEATKELQDREQKLLQSRVHAAEVEAARQKAVAEAQRNGITNYNQLIAIGNRAADIEQTRLAAIDQENDRYKAFVKTIDDLQRGLNRDQKTELQKQLEEIDLQFKAIYESAARIKREAPLTGAGRIEEAEQRLPGIRAELEFNARRKAAEDSAKAALQTRADLIKSYDKLYETGEITLAEKQQKTKEAVEATNGALIEAAESLEKWVVAAREAGNVPELTLKKAAAAAQEFRAETKYLDPFWKGLKDTIEDSVGTNLVTAFNSVAEAIGKAITKTGEWKDVWVEMGKAAGNFFASILKDIAAYIIKVEALKILQVAGFSLGLPTSMAATAAAGSVGAAGAGAAATGGLSAGWTSILSGAAAVAHEGGVVGSSALPVRSAPGGWFAGAPRYHTGGTVGLAANEQAAILQKGEEVLTADNPRNIVNLTRNETHHEQPRDINIRNILVADPDLVPSHMGSARGEKVIMSVLTKNVATVRQLVR